MRRVILFAVIALAVFSCTYGGTNESDNTDTTNMKADGTNNDISSDTDVIEQQSTNDRIKIETQ